MTVKFESKIIILFLLIGTLFSCTSKKNLIYLQSDGQQIAASVANFEPVLQSDDVVMIVVSAENPEIAAPYNMIQSNSGTLGGQDQLQSYLIDKEGNVDFPMLGKIKLAGLTRLNAIQKMKTLLENHIKEPIVNLRILNFKISVLGEVGRPGIYPIQSERITFLEALSLSGDLSIYGKRKNIMIIREKDGVKTIDKVDITKSDFINSPYYYLAQNDVIYVEPNKTKINSSVFGPNIGIAFSLVSLLITVITLTTR
ncbi:polysaccharide biosynthesis/export family protein [Flavobacterium sp. GT3R68]|uniref:polysaccharide biosynthesis/export family protein n=1 Tax=Flavobacterium sp. GT3R68 TaxID=2594437 RepID=UPI000F895FA1|nr:polysaccharide biosynthesis/export family protein [Flavobacterium sp. GT3R68]RTY92288.1 polysaccharide export protein [Flavobacterium sp. GSN2]TRW92524.1 polysaccharide export protein [Flavobacterium sp. GT3R68]